MKWLAALVLIGCGHRDDLAIARDSEKVTTVTEKPVATTPAATPEQPKPDASHDDIVPGAVFASATKVDEVDGRIVLIDAKGRTTYVSAGPDDHYPVLAPHRRA